MPIPPTSSSKPGEPWPDELRRSWWGVATVDTEYCRAGMPTHGLMISTPHLAFTSSKMFIDAVGRALRDHERTELRQLFDGCQLSDEDRAILDHLAPDAFEADG